MTLSLSLRQRGEGRGEGPLRLLKLEREVRPLDKIAVNQPSRWLTKHAVDPQFVLVDPDDRCLSGIRVDDQPRP